MLSFDVMRVDEYTNKSQMELSMPVPVDEDVDDDGGWEERRLPVALNSFPTFRRSRFPTTNRRTEDFSARARISHILLSKFERCTVIIILHHGPHHSRVSSCGVQVDQVAAALEVEQG